MGNKYQQKKRNSADFNIFIKEARTRLQNSETKHTKMSNTDNLLNILPCFDGKREANISFYITQFDEAAAQTKFSNEIKLIILKSKFTGIARDRLQADTDLHSETDYAKFTDKALKIFGSKISFSEAHENFAKLKQSPAESVGDFIVRFNLESAKFFETSGLSNKNDAKKLFELMKLNKFIEALKTEIGFEIRKRGVTKFTEATELAIITETAFNSTNFAEINQVGTNDTADFCQRLIKENQIQAENMAKLKLELENLKLKQQEKTQNNSSIKDKYCRICKLSNHVTENCRRNFPKQNTYNAQNSYPKYKQYTFSDGPRGEFSSTLQGFGAMPVWNAYVPPPTLPLASGQQFNPNYIPANFFQPQNNYPNVGGFPNSNSVWNVQNQPQNFENRQNWENQQSGRNNGNNYRRNNSEKNTKYQKNGHQGNGKGGL